MKLFFISKNYKDRYTASSKAKMDCERIVEKKGFKNIGLPSTCFQKYYIGRLLTFISNKYALMRMPTNSIAFLQYPVYGYSNQVNECIRNKNKIITIVHDLNVLRGIDQFSNIKILEFSDILIVHTEQMRGWLVSHLNVKKVLVLSLFDYLYSEVEDCGDCKCNFDLKSVAFAGNLKKSVFLDKVRFDRIQLNIFGSGIEFRSLNEGCVYQGCFYPYDLRKHLNSMFGLVWDGDSIETCSGETGEYLKYNIPHKLSMYISCGIPVIVWSQSAMADFVFNKKIGLVIDSIAEIEEIISKLSKSDYENMYANVMSLKVKVTSGYFLSKSIEEALDYLMCK